MKDYTNTRSGRLQVVSKVGSYNEWKEGYHKKYNYSYPIYSAICDCGEKIEVKHCSLGGKKPVKSCGCGRRGNLIGKKYGLGTVQSFSHMSKDQDPKVIRSLVVWNLICNCGDYYKASTQALQGYSKVSCGCASSKSSCAPKPWKAWFRRVENGRVRRNKTINFDISLDFCKKLLKKQNNLCALSGIKIDVETLGNASLDRMDSNKGYTPDNVQFVHKMVNYMKVDFDQKDFIDMCKKIAKNNP